MARGFYKKRHNVGQSIPSNQLHVGMLIHLSYTNFGYVWKILSIEPVNSKGEIWLNFVAPESDKKNAQMLDMLYTFEETSSERSANKFLMFVPDLRPFVGQAELSFACRLPSHVCAKDTHAKGLRRSLLWELFLIVHLAIVHRGCQ